MMKATPNYAFEPSGQHPLLRATGALGQSAPAARANRWRTAAQRRR